MISPHPVVLLIVKGVSVWKMCKVNYKLVYLGEKIGTKTQIPKKSQNLRHLLMEYNEELNKGE